MTIKRSVILIFSSSSSHPNGRPRPSFLGFSTSCSSSCFSQQNYKTDKSSYTPLTNDKARSERSASDIFAPPRCQHVGSMTTQSPACSENHVSGLESSFACALGSGLENPSGGGIHLSTLMGGACKCLLLFACSLVLSSGLQRTVTFNSLAILKAARFMRLRTESSRAHCLIIDVVKGKKDSDELW